MRTPSRLMPPYEAVEPLSSRVIGYGFLLFITLYLGYLLYTFPWITLSFFAFIALASLFHDNDATHLRMLQSQRSGENIGTFAFSLPYRKIDTWIIRAVYEEINHELFVELPIRASDSLNQDLRLDDESLYWIMERVMRRVGISEEGMENNPYYNKITTVENLILFLNAQPKSTHQN
jgi:hypothetical protein